MPNPLDDVMQDLRDGNGNPLRRVYITKADVPVDDSETDVVNRLERMVAPAPPEPQTDILALIAKVRDYLAGAGAGIADQIGVAGVEPGPVRDAARTGRNSLVGMAGAENDLWPVRMIKSGATLPGQVASGEVPVVDPETGRTSVSLIERAQDTAGMAGGGALTAKPGSATLGSGPVRRGPGMSEPVLTTAVKYNNRVYKNPGGEHIDAIPNSAFKTLNWGQDVTDIKGLDWGFIDHKGRFLDRKAAAEYAIEHGLIDPQFAKIAKKGGLISDMLLSDTQKPGAAISGAAGGPAPVFYSALEHVVSNAAQDTMSPQQWTGFLKNQPGLKTEELAWTGVGDWLAQQKGKVSKKDVQAYLDEHKIEIKDVTKSAQDPAALRAEAEDQLISAYGPRDWRRYSEAERQAMIDEHMGGLTGEHAPEGATKYSNWQLPGGENYREHLLTLPKELPYWDGGMGARLRHLKNKKDRTPVEQSEFQQLDAIAKKRDTAPDDYQSSHWDEPNVLAHVRTNERDVGGKRSLHIEEIQSDWHQQGRKKGYKAGDKFAVFGKDGAVKETYPSKEMAQAAIGEGESVGPWQGQGVPDAPFKTSWPELALKRMIRQAAEEGLERVSWTPGEAQAARYDLSKTIKKLQFQKNMDGTYNMWGETTAGGNHRFGQDIPVDKLADYVGKDVADKIVNQKFEIRELKDKSVLKLDPKVKFEVVDDSGKVRSWAETREQAQRQAELYKETGQLEGTDLKVGGEGMREFYDKMLPKMVEKIGKAHGVKVQKSKLHEAPDGPYTVRAADDGAGGFHVVDRHGEAVHAVPTRDSAKAWIDEQGGQPVYYFDLPPSMREHAIGKGFPLYMQGIPFPLTPVDYDPFEKKK